MTSWVGRHCEGRLTFITVIAAQAQYRTINSEENNGLCKYSTLVSRL